MRAAPAVLTLAALLVGGALAWVTFDVGGEGEQRTRVEPNARVPSADTLAAPTRTPAVEPSAGEARGGAASRAPSANVEPSAAGDGYDRGRIAALLADDDPRARFEGLRLLATAAPNEALPELLAYVEDTRDAERAHLQRLAAVALLGELDGVPVRDELVALWEREEPGARHAAALALARQGDLTLVDRELFALRTDLADPDGGVRARAAERAGSFDSPSAVPVLLPLLDDLNSDVRANAIDGLWRAGDVGSLPELERMLADPVELVRERARRAIDSLRADDAARGGS